MYSNSAESSPLDSDEDDVELSQGNKKTNDKKRQAHILSEQKRRDAIKKGYDELISILQTVDNPMLLCDENGVYTHGSQYNRTTQNSNENLQKLSKAGLLYKTQEYISSLQGRVDQQQQEMEMLQKEISALHIMKHNYQSMMNINISNQQLNYLAPFPLICENSPHLNSLEIIPIAQNKALNTCDNYALSLEQTENYTKNREIKSQVFNMIMDFLFLTFNASLLTSSFSELSKSLMSWLEEYCKPQNLREITLRILHQVNPKFYK